MENRADKPVVLIVEDDEDLATVIRAYLTKAGVDVRIAHNGRNAVDTLAQTPADLMLLDLGLPDMSGAELIAALRNRGVHVPFIVISGQDDQRTAVEMMKNGARDFIIKGSAFLDLLPSAVLQAIEQIRRDRRLAQAEQRIHEQNQFLQSILNSLPHPLYVIDAKTYAVQMANEAACLSLHNALPGQPLGTSESAKLTSGPAADSAIDEVKRTGRPLTLEHVQYDQERRSSIHEIHVCPVFAEEGGEVRQIIEYDLDVTTRKQAEQALRESEARLRQVVESLPIVLVSHAPQGRATLIIGAVQEMLGYEVSQLLDEPQAMAKVVHPEDIEQVLSTARAALTEHRSFELDFRVRHGTEQKDVWVHAQGVPVWDEEGALVRVDSILVDRTEERRIAAERERLESHLRQTQRLESLGNLAGGISHDFNNLLTVISGNISFLRQSASWSPTQSKALADIENATENATDMTKALEAFSQPSRPQMANVDANVLIQDVYRFLRRLIPARIEFSFHPAKMPCRMAVDPGQLQQVLINLCINARDAMRGPGQLEIRTRRVEPTQLPPRIKGEGKDLPLIEIAVRDTGCGMDANILRQVFDPFFTTKAKDQGTGLGLAIVYRIVQAHGGTIEVNSIPGQGTEFRVYLPQAQADVSEPAEQPQVHGTEQILVVDDEVMIASLLRTVLERSGYEVKVAHDANEAIAIAEQSDKPIDLTVMDYSLPGMTGDCCLARLREKWPKLAAVIITGHPVDNHELSVNNARILAKPFTSTAITQAVRETLHG